MIKKVEIDEILVEEYEGDVFNVELETLEPNKIIDDLYWVDFESKIISHNCLPKDLKGIIAAAYENGYDSKLLKEVWKSNIRIGAIRKERKASNK